MLKVAGGWVGWWSWPMRFKWQSLIGIKGDMSVIVGRLRSQDDSLGYMAARLVCLLVTVLMYRAEVHTVIVCREVTGLTSDRAESV